MRWLPYVVVFLILLLGGGYWLTQTDYGILWCMRLNPAKLTVRRVQGKDGYMMVYSNETALVYITHSAVSGVSVTRMKP
jgi:hypothetical protein